MTLSIGIVGLPNVGKSTLFNALTKAQNAQAANYPFCTIEPNKAIVPVPDTRVQALSALVRPQKTIHATVEFTDIAGLVKGASQGEGLGNQFLANIRESDAVMHVVRCFEDGDVAHVDGDVDPVRDAEVIEMELILADVQSLERKLERLRKQTKSGDKQARALAATGEGLLAHLNAGQPALTFSDFRVETAQQLVQELGLLTAKPVLYCANVREDELDGNARHFQALQAYAATRQARVIPICAKMEAELAALDDQEQAEFLDSYGVQESGIIQVIQTGYTLLGLISYFTAGPKEVRAWTIQKG
ncbi:MAG: redox-regulated ATPase YchF, partial [Desulfohalobium sp.]